MKNILRRLVLFYVGFSTYITIEVLFHSRMRMFEMGWSYIASGIMGAAAFMILDMFNNNISWDIELQYQMIVSGIVVTLIEFLVGIVSVFVFHVHMWDYSNLKFNLYGVICPQFFIFWVLLSAIAILLADVINYYVFNEGPRPYYIIFGKKFSFIER